MRQGSELGFVKTSRFPSQTLFSLISASASEDTNSPYFEGSVVALLGYEADQLRMAIGDERNAPQLSVCLLLLLRPSVLHHVGVAGNLRL